VRESGERWGAMGQYRINGRWYVANSLEEAREEAERFSQRQPLPPRAAQAGQGAPTPPPSPRRPSLPGAGAPIPPPAVLQPPAVAAPAGIAAPAAGDQIPQNVLILFRADSRSPGELKRDGGYKPWAALDLDVTRDMIKFVAGLRSYAEFPSLIPLRTSGFPPTGIDQSVTPARPLPLEANPTRNPKDLHEWIIRSKDRGPAVSFALTEEGTYPYGAGSVYIYKVAFPLREIAWDVAVPGGTMVPNVLTPKLYLDADTLAGAQHIALKGVHGNEEVSCFYTVEKGEIFTFKEPDGAGKKLVDVQMNLDNAAITRAPKKSLW
jgi:hypothetical protein